MNRNSALPHHEGPVRSASATTRETTPSALHTDANTLMKQFMESSQPGDLAKAIEFYRKALELLPLSASDSVRFVFLSNLASALSTQFLQSRLPKDLEEGISLHRQALELQPESHGDKPKTLSNLALALSQTGRPEDLKEAISFHQQAFKLLPASDPYRSTSLNNLDSAIWTQFDQSHQPEDLNEVILLRRSALENISAMNPDRYMYLNRLASALSVQFEQSGLLDHLDEAIVFHRQALDRQPKFHRDRYLYLTYLTSALSAHFEQSGQHHLLEEEISLHRQALQPPHEPQPVSLNNLALALLAQFSKSSRLKDLEEGISLHRKALQLLPDSHFDHYITLNNLAFARLAQYNKSGRLEVLDEVISLHRKALQLVPDTDLDRSMCINRLAISLLTRYRKSGQLKDLTEGISFHRDALQLLPNSHSDRSKFLNNLAHALMAQFRKLHRVKDLEEGIALHRKALELLHGSDPDRFEFLNDLALALLIKFRKSPRLQDLEEGISSHRKALGLLSNTHPDRFVSLNNLALAVWTRYKQSSQRKDLKEVISLYGDALKLPASPPIRSLSYISLAEAVWEKFKQSGDRKDLEEVILLYREALELLPALQAERYRPLSNLALAVWTQFKDFKQSGGNEELEEVVLLYQEALDLLPASHAERSTCLSNLASTRLTQFTQSSNSEHLEKAISLNKEALDLRSGPHPDRYMSLNNLASALWIQFVHLGQPEDLENAISSYRKARELQPKSSRILSNLALALSQSGGHKNLDDAVSLHREALELRPKPHLGRSVTLSNLASTLWRLCEQLGRPEDLEEAISFHREALDLRAAPNADRFKSLNNLALALWTRFTKSDRLEDLEKAIGLYRQALKLPATETDRGMTLSNLALALSTRFKKSKRPEDLEEAIDKSSRSLKNLIRDHPSACSCLRNDGYISFVAYSHKAPKYLDKAMKSFEDAVACKAAPASLRFHVAKEWASRADESKHSTALTAYQEAIQLLPHLAMLGLDFESRQKALESGTDGLARDAAACAIRSKKYKKAVELLEEGRAVFWSQALQIRSPALRRLRDVDSKLAVKIEYLSLTLERGSFRDVSMSLSDDTRTVISMEAEAAYFRRLNDEWQEAVKEVRLKIGFEDFLRPSRISTLLGATIKGPLVILNASVAGCAALILTPAGVQHVSLPDLTFAEVSGLAGLMKRATAPGNRDALPSGSDRAYIKDLVRQIPYLSDTLQPLEQSQERANVSQVSMPQVAQLAFPPVLKKLWKSVVKPVIDKLEWKKSDRPPNLWWCPTGPFTFLPMHAAGIYNTRKDESVFDYVVSSYTPTIGVLLRRRDTARPSTPFNKMVVVTDPDLTHTGEERKRIKGCIPVTNANMPMTELVELVSGTVEQVTSYLPSSSIAHFACHGEQDVQKPLDSALLLEDGSLTVTMVYEKMLKSKSTGMLAFLAACQTATGDGKLPDEVIHIGSSLLFAGFPGVVATMWNISDVDGPEVAEAFYKDLFIGATQKGGKFQPDTTRAARALHRAVAKLRSKEEKVPFIHWVPFIHMGW